MNWPFSDPNSTVLCSNRGECVCGECICFSKQNPGEIISGDFCECDTFSCARDINGRSCGGRERGTCCDGECHCEVFIYLFTFILNENIIWIKINCLMNYRKTGLVQCVTAVPIMQHASVSNNQKKYVRVMEPVIVESADAMTSSMENFVKIARYLLFHNFNIYFLIYILRELNTFTIISMNRVVKEDV